MSKDNFKPTNGLRFIESTVRGQLYSHRTLQQWWENINYVSPGCTEVQTGMSSGEWRDVPIEKEFIDKENT